MVELRGEGSRGWFVHEGYTLRNGARHPREIGLPFLLYGGTRKVIIDDTETGPSPGSTLASAMTLGSSASRTIVFRPLIYQSFPISAFIVKIRGALRWDPGSFAVFISVYSPSANHLVSVLGPDLASFAFDLLTYLIRPTSPLKTDDCNFFSFLIIMSAL